MNQSFENIFEKYNITCNYQRRRPKNKTILTQPRMLSNVSQSRISNYNTLRYKRLNIIKEEKRINSENTLNNENKTRNNNCNSKENHTQEISAGYAPQTRTSTGILPNYLAPCLKFQTSLQNAYKQNQTKAGSESCSFLFGCNKKFLTDSFVIRKSKLKKTSKNQLYSQCLPYKQLNVMPIQNAINLNASNENKLQCEILNHSDNLLSKQTFNSSECSSLKSEIEKTQTFDKPADVNTPTELDLLIDLIEQEKKSNENLKRCKKNEKPLNYADNKLRHKSCLKGGYEERFLKYLKCEKVKSNFLKYDKKVGLRSGHLLTVVDIETYYGLTLAIVKSNELHKKLAVLVAQEMMPRLKIGTQIEAFFDDKTILYELKLTGECLDVYLEPYKLLIV